LFHLPEELFHFPEDLWQLPEELSHFPEDLLHFPKELIHSWEDLWRLSEELPAIDLTIVARGCPTEQSLSGWQTAAWILTGRPYCATGRVYFPQGNGR
jgi:hypothetical protein